MTKQPSAEQTSISDFTKEIAGMLLSTVTGSIYYDEDNYRQMPLFIALLAIGVSLAVIGLIVYVAIIFIGSFL